MNDDPSAAASVSPPLSSAPPPHRIVSAGGVVFSRRSGRLLIALMEDHRGRWLLPKGKREPGESLEETALREIWEETGVEGRVVQPLETVEYRYRHPRRGTVEKVVHYFLVEKATEASNPNIERIFALAWFPPAAAWKKQCQSGYSANRSVLRKAFAALGAPDPLAAE